LANAEPQFLYSFLLDGDGPGKALDVAAIRSWKAADGKLWLHFDVVYSVKIQ
jgi:hypothetical protein